jgi:hypothetical protein
MRKLGQNLVDRVFDEGLANAELPVSGKVWDGISSELEKDGLRRAVVWYRSIAVASVLLLIGLGAWTLAGQAGSTGSDAGLAAGKPMRPYELGLSLRDCPADVQETFATTATQPAGQQGSTYNGNLVRTVHSTVVAAPHNNFTITELRLKEMAVAHPHLQPMVERATEGIQHMRDLIQPRNPSLMPVIAARDLRAVPATVVSNQGPFAELLPSKMVEKRKEKEYAFALDEDALTTPVRKHWELGAGFAPDMTFASTTPVEQNARSSQIIADDPLDANTKRLSPVMAYVSGIRASYEFNDRWSVRSGLSYVNRETSTTESVNNYGKIDAYQSTLSLSSLEIPVTVRYNLIASKHLDYYVASGVSGNFLLHYDNAQVTSKGTIAARRQSSLSEVMQPSQANILVSTGVKYRLMDRLNLQVEPGLRYGVLTNDYAFSQSRPVSLNLMTGLNYHF